MNPVSNGISTTIETEITANLEKVFAHIVPIDLSSIFTGYGPLPAVTATFNQTGAWDGVGQTRSVALSDSSSANECITGYKFPSYFSYTVSEFTGALRFLASSANGEWWFDGDAVSGKTQIKWRYQFIPRSKLAIPALWLITKVFWRGYMNKALLLCNLQIMDLAEKQKL